MTRHSKFVLLCALLFNGFQLPAQHIETKAPGAGVHRAYRLPERGLCAHRGAMDTHPENTLPAFRAAVGAGAQMIEMDVYQTRDHQLVVIHDATVDRTTNGKGKVSELTLEEIKALDAGSWKSPEFAGERIPTLQEVLALMPFNTWLNIHVKEEGHVPGLVARLLQKEKRLHQAFLACSVKAARQAKEVVPGILTCNMDRQGSAKAYVDLTTGAKSDFIQLQTYKYPEFESDVRRLKNNGVRINYFGTNSPAEIKWLLDAGVDFPLVNDIVHLADEARKLGIEPVVPVFSPAN